MQKTTALPLKKILIFIILATLVSSMSLIMLPGKIYGATLNVGPGETYTTIQSAINAATDGDIIMVAAGTYTESLTIGKSITLTGAGASITVIDPAAGRCIYIASGIVNISGFTIRGGSSSAGGGISNQGTLNITNCIISGNSATNFGGGISNHGTLNISNSTISGNTAVVGGGGIINHNILNITNSTISGNTAIEGGGIGNWGSALSDAKNNWWGSPTGPTHPSNPGGAGDSISNRVDYIPWLTNPPGYTEPGSEEPIQWVRNVQMTCYQVWINDAGNFEFVFWWEYKNNNWVKIYDMDGTEVFSIDMKYGNAKFEAELLDGMYTVKTFHLSETPIQEFIIGKP